jgi:hypothetical protein
VRHVHPGWMRRRGKQRQYSEPVSLADAMVREDHAAWPVMVAQHAACPIALTSAAARAVTEDAGGELAAVLQPASTVTSCPAAWSTPAGKPSPPLPSQPPVASPASSTPSRRHPHWPAS